MASVPPRDWRTAARTVAAQVWLPVAQLLADDGPVVVAPDGALSMLPFDALIADGDEPLLSTRALSFVATGRDLHRFAHRPNWATLDPVVVAGPDFGGNGAPFAPFRGAAAEGEAIAALLDVRPVTGAAATRGHLLAVTDPEVLHVATHGYSQPSGDRIGEGPTGVAPLVEHPLLTSGLALAGANVAARPGAAPGVVTALDVLGMQLLSTDLVVLSACETGLGPLDDEEGLLGLARSFLLAGARSVVWSLWKVDDDATAALMEGFYRRVLAERPRAEALQEAKRDLYREAPDRPALWAGFVLQGDRGRLLRHVFALPPEDQYVTLPVRSDGTVHRLDTGGRPFATFEVDVGGEPFTVASMNLRNLGLVAAEEEHAAALVAFRAGRAEDAERHWREALERLGADAAAGRPLLAAIHDGLAVVTGLRGAVGESHEHGLLAVAGYEAAGDRERLGGALDNLATAESQLGDNEAALVSLRRAATVKRSLDPPSPTLEYTEQLIALLEGGADDRPEPGVAPPDVGR